MNLEKFAADELWRTFVLMFLIICALWGGVFYLAFMEHNPKCTDEQLHKVIQSVNECNKKNVICSAEKKDEILREVCK